MASPLQIEERVRNAINLALQDSASVIEQALLNAIIKFDAIQTEQQAKMIPPIPATLVAVPFCKDCAMRYKEDLSNAWSCNRLSFDVPRYCWPDENQTCIFVDFSHFFVPLLGEPKGVPP